ncbi:ATP-binding protein [Paraburkholderia sp. RL17-337-BIB-A]
MLHEINAIEALTDCANTAARRGELRLVTSLRGKHARVQVIDNGSGVPAEAHGRLFDGFSSSKAGGNGHRFVAVQKHRHTARWRDLGQIGTAGRASMQFYAANRGRSRPLSAADV